jgi:hypothetical protein
MAIKALLALARRGEAAEAWETQGEQASKTVTQSPSLAHLSFLVAAQQEVLKHYPHGSSNCLNILSRPKKSTGEINCFYRYIILFLINNILLQNG